MRFCFVGLYVATKTAIRCVRSSVDGDLVIWDEKDCVGRFHSATYSLCESAKFVRRGCVPYYFVFGVPHELPVIEVFPSFFVADKLDAFTLLLGAEFHVSSQCQS